ncbi:MAG: alpha-amylase family glycosyl hydrolase [Chitinophagales bacterium]
MRLKLFLLFLCAYVTFFAVAQQPWYHHTTIYQIYPRSFADSNGDGIGDIPGIISKLDYIKDLGYETIWVSPFFESPQQDFGYDISNYCDIAPEYGTLDNAIQLIEEVHKRNMKIVFDMVMNHTSSQHAWFQRDLENKTDSNLFYIWANKPNRWQSALFKKGWHYAPERKQYYWASFLPFQPDLNYRNPEVKKQMFTQVRFWLEHGVDGFRLDMFNSIYKDSLLRNNAASRREVSKHYNTKGFFHTIKGSVNQPQSFEFAKELRTVCDSFGTKMLLGEVFGNHAMIRNFSGKEQNDGLGLVFNFEMLRFHFSAHFFRKTIAGLERDFARPFAPVYVFSNHDRRRSATRLKGNARKEKLLALLQLTARGTACMYYGEELGMQDVRMPYRKALDPIPHLYKALPRFLVDWHGETLNRDELRTPMAWDSSATAGFSSSTKTWLPLHADHNMRNAASEISDSTSLLQHVKKLLHLRNNKPSLSIGTLELLNLPKCPRNVLVYSRKWEGEELWIVLNFNKQKQHLSLPNQQRLIYSTVPAVKTDSGLKIDGYSGVILEMGKRP